MRSALLATLVGGGAALRTAVAPRMSAAAAATSTESLVIWDCDGCLVDSEALLKTAEVGVEPYLTLIEPTALPFWFDPGYLSNVCNFSARAIWRWSIWRICSALSCEQHGPYLNFGDFRTMKRAQTERAIRRPVAAASYLPRYMDTNIRREKGLFDR